MKNLAAISEKAKIDWAVDLSPDLAIEVDFTSLKNIKSYEYLKISKLWIYLLDKNSYQSSLASLLFTKIDVKTSYQNILN